jgi:oligopeptide transport system substrate-binding protein
MQKVKWIFFSYVGLVILLIAGLAVSFVKTPPRDPKTFYTFYLENVKTLDPAACDDEASANMIGNVYETLYTYAYGVEPYTLIPQLASEMPVVSDGGKTVTIKVRRGVHYYDPLKKVFPDGVGPEVKAQDFVYSWKRICNFQLGHTANYGAMFQGKVVGLDEWWDYTKNSKPGEIDWDRPVAGLAAIDDYTIQIKLIDPYPQLRYNLAHEPTSAMCRAVVEKLGDGVKGYCVGTGALALSEYLPEQHAVYTANPLYRGRPDVDSPSQVKPEDRLPRTQRVQVDYFPEDVPRWLLFRQGYFDGSSIPRDAFGQAIGGSGDLTPEMERDGVILKKYPEPATFFRGFNMLDPVVGKNKPLRQAMSMAYDRETYIRIYINGRGQPANGIISPGFETFDPHPNNPYTQFNLAAAKEKLREAEKINGGPIPEMTVAIGDTTTRGRQDGEYFAQQMAQIGLKVNYKLTTFARFLEMVDDKEVQLFSLGWIADYPDEQTFLQLYYSKNAGRGGVNQVNYSNPEYDKIYEQAVVMEPSPQRAALYRKLQAIINEDCPCIFEFHPLVYSLRYSWLHDSYPMIYGNGGKMSWSYITIDSAARADWVMRHR